MSIAAIKQQSSESEALPCRAQARRTQTIN
jgi:hypothetical protein